MNISKVLPVGTVVKLKEAEKRISIIGIFQQTVEEAERKEYDYVGVPYPEGFLGVESMILFQNSDIEGVVFLGYSDVERQAFVVQVAEMIEKRDKKKE